MFVPISFIKKKTYITSQDGTRIRFPSKRQFRTTLPYMGTVRRKFESMSTQFRIRLLVDLKFTFASLARKWSMT